jgi:hypothetical protein
MKKMLLTLLTMFIALSMLSIPAHAGPPKPAEGLWRYKPSIVDVRIADGNTFFTTTEEGEWTGTFVGTSSEEGKVVIHRSGFWSFNGLVFFDAVTVDGKSGTLVMSAVGKRADVFADWQGKWVILSGTGDLASLRGQGTWWGPGAPEVEQWGDIYYSGKIHFEP